MNVGNWISYQCVQFVEHVYKICYNICGGEISNSDDNDEENDQ